MSKPIPDKTLLDFVEAEHELVSLPGYGTVSCSDLGAFGEDMALELLALREAARRVGGWGQASAPYNCKCGWFMPVCDGPSQMSAIWSEHAENCAIEAIRALLPKESP